MNHVMKVAINWKPLHAGINAEKRPRTANAEKKTVIYYYDYVLLNSFFIEIVKSKFSIKNIFLLISEINHRLI